eukprot:SAG31_NODE_24414_length_481_cov_13.785340_1_plen_76_part_00
MVKKSAAPRLGAHCHCRQECSASGDAFAVAAGAPKMLAVTLILQARHGLVLAGAAGWGAGAAAFGPRAGWNAPQL